MQRRKPGGCYMESNRKKDPKLTEFLRRIIQDSGFTYESIAEMLDVSNAH